MNLVKADSIGDSSDLLLDKSKLGFDLPSNDQSKAGKLDQMSVDSFWVDDNDIKKIEELKKIDPIKLDFNQVYKQKLPDQNENI